MTYEDSGDKFQKAQFGDYAFPYSQITIKGGIRHHVHEYPHSPGGDVEKMGRKLYTFRFRVPFHDIPGSRLAVEFQGLFPNRLRNLIALFDRQASLPLVIPSVGTMVCVATDWDGLADMADALSGETWNIEFIEDVDQASIVKALPSLGVASMVAAADNFEALWKKLYFATKPPSIFQAINDLVTAIDGTFGQFEAYSRLVAGKLEGLAQLCQKADSDVAELRDPMNHLVVEALKDVWASAVDLSQNISGPKGGELSTFRVPRLMSIGQVATKLYGSADRGIDIMQINPIDDPFAIKAGTELQYVKAA